MTDEEAFEIARAIIRLDEKRDVLYELLGSHKQGEQILRCVQNGMVLKASKENE